MKSAEQQTLTDAPSFSNEAIIAAAGRLGAKYERCVGRDYILHHGWHFDKFYEEVIYPDFEIRVVDGVELGKDEDGTKILGRFDVLSNVAFLDASISRESRDPRRTFTCWHEVAGHGALQGRWLRKRLELLGVGSSINVTEVSLSRHARLRLEQQANLFAAYLAAPNWLVNHAIMKILRPSRRFLFLHPCMYWLDSREAASNKFVQTAEELSRWIGVKISGYFGGLSAEAIGYRVAKLGWIDDRSSKMQLFRRDLGNVTRLGESFDFSDTLYSNAS